MSAHANPNIITDGLIVCFDANDIKSYSGSGTTWTDRIANLTLTDSDLTFHNENSGVLSESANSTLFFTGGTDAGVELNNQTFIIWSKTETNMSTTGGGSFSDWILQLGTYYANNSCGIGGQSGAFYLFAKGSTSSGWSTVGSATLSNTPYENNKWVMYTVKFISNTNIEVYMNNTKIVDNTLTDGFNGLAADSIYLKKGIMGNKIGSFRIYDRVLSDNEILQNYTADKSRFQL